jgi:prepilin-type N-terminal cleavage/methylation domain-containing protein
MKSTIHQSLNHFKVSHSRHKLKSSYEAGFTIVETLIVLAIAGLILLIVFEAIPALTRNARNGQRKQDVIIMLDAISRYELKDSGNYPQTCGPGSPYCNASIGNISLPNDNFLQFSKNELTFYTQDDSVVLRPESSGSVVSNLPLDTETVHIYNFQKCDPVHVGSAISAGADYSDVVALYAIEAGHNVKAAQCQQL